MSCAVNFGGRRLGFSELRVIASFQDILNMSAPDVTIDGTGKLVISSEEGETDDLEEKTLDELGMIHSARLSCDDFLQNFNVVSTLRNNKISRSRLSEIFFVQD